MFKLVENKDKFRYFRGHRKQEQAQIFQLNEQFNPKGERVKKRMNLVKRTRKLRNATRDRQKEKESSVCFTMLKGSRQKKLKKGRDTNTERQKKRKRSKRKRKIVERESE